MSFFQKIKFPRTLPERFDSSDISQPEARKYNPFVIKDPRLSSSSFQIPFSTPHSSVSALNPRNPTTSLPTSLRLPLHCPSPPTSAPENRSAASPRCLSFIDFTNHPNGFRQLRIAALSIPSHAPSRFAVPLCGFSLQQRPSGYDGFRSSFGGVHSSRGVNYPFLACVPRLASHQRCNLGGQVDSQLYSLNSKNVESIR